MLEIWPNLEVFFHGGVNFSPYSKQFKLLLPHERMTYMETYNASEGFFGLQDRTDENDMLLMLDYGIFYEFIPMNELENEHPKTQAYPPFPRFPLETRASGLVPVQAPCQIHLWQSL